MTATRDAAHATDERSAVTEQESEQISWFPVTDEADFDDAVRSYSQPAKERFGFLPNVFRIWGWKRQRFSKWREHLTDLMRGSPGLSEGERELIASVVSFENRCVYCLTSHSANARMLLGDPVLVDRAIVDYRRAGLSVRQEAMLAYVLKITRSSVDCSEEDIERLREVGFSDEDIWDIAELAAMYNMTNRLASAAGMLPNREYHNLGR